MTRILIVEDEESYREPLVYQLTREGYEVSAAATGEEGLELFTHGGIDLVLLDLMLPGIDGTTLCRRIREQSRVPIIMLTAKSTEIDKVVGLEIGADDYVTKPYSFRELLARIRTSMRHNHSVMPESVYRAKDLEIHFGKHMILLRGEEVHLTQIEYQLLELLAEHSGKVLTYNYIMKAIWGPYTDNDNQILRVNMANIRRKIELNPAQPEYLFTEVGIGYRILESNAL